MLNDIIQSQKYQESNPITLEEKRREKEEEEEDYGGFPEAENIKEIAGKKAKNEEENEEEEYNDFED